MRRLVAWIGGAVGGFAAYRFLRRHAGVEPLPEPTPAEPDERAEELRAKLAETRVAGEEAVEEAPSVAAEEEPAADAPPPEAAAEPAPEEASAEPSEEPESLDERRRRVHEEGRAALDEMQHE